MMNSNFTSGDDLSDKQRELLESATNEGYFKVPRETSLAELARAYGMSDQEASEQLRHGLDVLIRETLLDE